MVGAFRPTFFTAPGVVMIGRLVSIVAVLLTTALATTAAAAPPGVPGAPTEPPCPVRSGPLRLADLPNGTNVAGCALVGRQVTVGPLHVAVPRAGEAVTANQLRVDGSTEVRLVVAPNGRLTVDAVDPVHTGKLPVTHGSGRHGPDKGCVDKGYRLLGKKQKSPLYWYFNRGSIPKGYHGPRVVAAAVQAAATVAHGVAPCPGYRTDRVSLPVVYRGSTTSALDVRYDTCNARVDHRNTVGFVRQRPGVVAGTCTLTAWNDPHKIVDADIAINSRYWFTAAVGPNCRDRYDLRSVLTHEFGHAVGLADVDPTYHYWMTMGGSIGHCTTFKRTLGAGDVLGLRRLY